MQYCKMYEYIGFNFLISNLTLLNIPLECKNVMKMYEQPGFQFLWHYPLLADNDLQWKRARYNIRKVATFFTNITVVNDKSIYTTYPPFEMHSVYAVPRDVTLGAFSSRNSQM